MSLTVSYCCLFYLTLTPVRWSLYMSVTVSTISMELLHVSFYLPWLMAVSVSPVPWSC